MDKATYVVAMLERLGPPATLHKGFCHAAEHPFDDCHPSLRALPMPHTVLSTPRTSQASSLGKTPSDDVVLRPARS